jgi:UDP-N-acetylmuramyl pentapeptide phosphotransferase/UDP-N-acetylglucosamine-1-phosphate transferase
MEYIIVAISLLIIELFYFKTAEKLNIIDKPNERSSHTQITLRGGGIIFYFGVAAYFVYSKFQYPWFFLGLSLIALVSFIDDVFTLANKPRLAIHFISILLMCYEINLFSISLWLLLVLTIIIIGIINAYNFMDGINGITASYSLAILTLLVLVNNKIYFVDINFIVYIVLAILIFAFFNFRQKAVCFAGDVGSISIAFIVVFLTLKLIVKTENPIYILFLSVYGIDTVWTIVRRLLRRENIFKAHRTHLYQLMTNEIGYDKLLVSLGYGLLQLTIGGIVIFCAEQDANIQIAISTIVIVILSIVYLFWKNSIIKYTNNS